eukprot:gene28357-34235_t
MDEDFVLPEPAVNSIWNVNVSSLPTCPSGIDALLDPNHPSRAEILWRDCYDSYRGQMLQIEQGRRLSPIAQVLTGPAGAGKSCMLYALAQYARHLGFLTFYVPNLLELITLSPKSLAKHILSQLQLCNPTWPYGQLTVDEHEDNILDVAREALESLHIGGQPACIFIDQWNCVVKNEASFYFKSLFGTFNTLRLTKGATFAAVTSSFRFPQELFSDADAVTHCSRVPLYSDDEYHIMMEHCVQSYRLPQLSAEQHEELRHICGKVGCVLYFAQVAWSERQPRTRDQWQSQDSQRTVNLANVYYAHKVESLLAGVLGGSATLDEKITLVLFIARLFLNKYSESDLKDMPASFKWVGLYDASVESRVPVCPAVVTAIHQSVADSRRSLVEILVKRFGTRGTALELFVEASLRGGDLPKTLNVTCTDLSGQNQQYHQLHVSNVRIQDKADPASCLNDICNGTLIVCHEGHPVTSMVLYSNGCVFFLQISIQSYTKHSTKIEHLASCRMTSTTQSVYSFYCDRAPTGWSIPKIRSQFTDKIAKKVKYIYCTTDSTSHNSIVKGATKHVLLIGGHLLGAFGAESDLFLQHV